MILNLIDVIKSDIKYTTTTYPDSHTHVTLEKLSILHPCKRLTIKTRLNSLDSVFILLQATNAIRAVRSDMPIDLCITYLICGRYDRPMSEYDSFDLKIITDLINQQNYQTVTVYEPHSIVTTSLLRGKDIHIMDEAVRKELLPYRKVQEGLDQYVDVCLIAPDLGAVKRVEDFAKTLQRPIPIVYAHKERDLSTGDIKGIKILNPENLRKNVLIYDDLCDGGRTFIELAKVLKSLNPHVWITLAVTHGIFSKGFEVLFPWITKVITTNSYKDFSSLELDNKNVEVINVV